MGILLESQTGFSCFSHSPKVLLNVSSSIMQLRCDHYLIQKTQLGNISVDLHIRHEAVLPCNCCHKNSV